MLSKGEYSPVGTAIYPFLERASTKFNDKGVYSTKLRLSGDEALKFKAQIDEWMEKSLEIAKESAETPAKAKKKKLNDAPYEEVLDEEGNETGEIDFKFKAMASGQRKDKTRWTFKLPIFDVKGKEIPSEVGMAGGSTIRLKFNADEYDVPATGVGVSLKLQGVQLLKLQKYGNSMEAMEGFEDGYSYSEDDAVTPAVTPATANEDEDDVDDDEDF